MHAYIKPLAIQFKKHADAEIAAGAKAYMRNSQSKEFFIQKAIGWALREYSKTDPVWVKQFVKKNKLALLSEREALKRIFE